MKLKLILVIASFIASLAGAERVPWTTSRVLGSPEKPHDFKLERRFDSLSFTNAIDLVFSRELNRWFLGDQSGKLFSFDARGKNLNLAADFSSLQGRDGAFYALTLDPNFRSNRFVYVCYAQKPELPDGSRVSRFKVTGETQPRIDFASEEILITWLSGGHNGCCLKFGKDRYLYISTGDAAGPNPPDPLKTGQDVTDFLSSVLRIDVHNKDAGKNYRVPSDNPFVGHPKARPEIWAYGFRNPWRFGIDLRSGDLWVADVGWELWELIYKVQPGGNYGWSIVEGRQPVLPNDPLGPTPILPPIKDHPHNEAASITGGFVYYGAKFPSLAGAFIYGDWETGKIWALRAEQDKVTYSAELADSTTRIISFAEDAAGEIFVLDYNGGIYELVRNTNPHSPADFPKKLSDTGLFSSVPKLTPAPGVYPFQVNAEMWSDFATAERLIALPGNSSVTNTDAWRFPLNAVLVRTISLEMERGNGNSTKRIETQLLHHTGDGWGAYSYKWRDDQSDADLVPIDGADELLQVKDHQQPGGIRLQPWRFSGRAECLRCHNSWCGTALAFQPEQLGKQFDELAKLKLIATKPKEQKKQLVSPYNHAADLDARARSYLHINCSHCHREAAGGSVPTMLNFDLPLEKTRSVNARPILGDLGLTRGKVIAPGEPFSSVLLFRASATGRSRMPYLASELVDDEGIALLREWIHSLDQKSSASQLTELKRELTSSAPQSLASKHTANTSFALLLAHALSDSSVSVSTKEQVATAAATSSNPLIVELFERFLPSTARTNLSQPAARPEEILALRGDAKRGATLLNDSARLSCLQCHQFNFAGRAFGPAFKDACKNKSRAQILDSILYPSRDIAPEYVLYSIELTDDELLSGLIVNRAANELILRDPTGADHPVRTSQIKSTRPQRLSAMPEGLLTGLSPQQIADLLEALVSEAK